SPARPAALERAARAARGGARWPGARRRGAGDGGDRRGARGDVPRAAHPQAEALERRALGAVPIWLPSRSLLRAASASLLLAQLPPVALLVAPRSRASSRRFARSAKYGQPLADPAPRPRFDGMSELADRRCVSCDAGTPKLSSAEAEELRRKLSGWELR